jgi:predicted dehydrogenase/threonine dehydrogenase-like Zn-dependent dehydrogenase
MRQVLISKGRARLGEVPSPLIEPGHVLIAVAYSAVSTGTEMASVRSSGASIIDSVRQSDRLSRVIEHLQAQGIRKTIFRVQSSLSTETGTGYSSSGIVMQVGEGVSHIHVGDRVACAGARHAEIVLVPANLVVALPEGCRLRDASTVALGAIALQGVRRAAAELGDVVAVIGLGLVGQLTVQLLRISGCRVIGIDLDPRRTALARSLGADRTYDSSAVDVVAEVLHDTEAHGADRTIITAATSSSEPVQQAMRLTRRKGRVVIVGAVGMALQRSPFYEKELDVVMSCSYGPGRYDSSYEQAGIDYPFAYVRWTEQRNMAEYLRLVEQGMVRLDSIIEREFPLEQVDNAYSSLNATEGPRPLAVVIRYPIDASDVPTIVPTPLVRIAGVDKPGRVGVAVVGAGQFAYGTHLPNLQSLAHLFDIRAVVSRTAENARATARLVGASIATTDLDLVLGDPAIDAVVLATRHHLHASQSLAALQAGKAVYVEKPLCLTLAELEAIASVFGVMEPPYHQVPQPAPTMPILLVGYNRRFSPPISRLKTLLLARRDPLIATYRVNAGYVPPTSWVHGPEGGGRLLGEACHMVDVMNYLVGFPLRSLSVQSLTPRSAHHSPHDNVVLLFEYVDGSVVTITYTALGHGGLPKEYLEVFWDGKAATLHDYTVLRVHGVRGQDWSSPRIDKGHLQAMEHFGRAVRNHEGPWPVTLAELLSVSHTTLIAADMIAAIT